MAATTRENTAFGVHSMKKIRSYTEKNQYILYVFLHKYLLKLFEAIVEWTRSGVQIMKSMIFMRCLNMV